MFAHTKSNKTIGGKKERVLLIVLQDISPALSHSSALITETVVVKGFGVRSSKYFLKAGYTGADKTVRRGHNFLQEKVPLHLFVQSRCWHQAANH